MTTSYCSECAEGLGLRIEPLYVGSLCQGCGERGSVPVKKGKKDVLVVAVLLAMIALTVFLMRFFITK